MDSLNYLKAVKDGQLHFANGSIKHIPYWGDPAWAHFFCVRHAEKAKGDPHDPGLSTEGEARAEHLGRIMAEVGLDAVYATPYRRAQLTAEPVQRRGKIPALQTYEPGNQDEWLLEILPNSLGKKIMVVGHQNTIPQLLNQLAGGGFDFDNIPDWDYGQFYALATQGIGEEKAPMEVLIVRY